MISPDTIIRFIVAIPVLFFAALLFQAGSHTRCYTDGNHIPALFVALQTYHTEYDRYPRITTDGRCETAEANANLMQVLSGLDKTENPRGVCFIEAPKAHEWKGKFCSGIDPSNGAWNDKWGNFYRIRIATDSTATPQSPYSDEKSLPPGTHFIVWSVGKDGVQGNSVKSDDVVSWR